jgi:hypothetical protein
MGKDARGAVVSVRLSEEEQARLRKIADARGTSISELIRSYVAAEVRPVPRGETVASVPTGHLGTAIVTWHTTARDEADGATLTVYNADKA